MPVYIVDPKPMTHDEIVKAVRRIRYSSKAQRNGRRIPSVHALAAAAGVTRQTIYNITQTGQLSAETADNLRQALNLSSNPED